MKKLSPALAISSSGGYFCVDPGFTPGKPVFNRTIGLRYLGQDRAAREKMINFCKSGLVPGSDLLTLQNGDF
ncbi:MAG: hypothetical protein IPG76_22290 [Acidobacteria bacterium]|nr:hypothetical protein [Acidobacteriota bacterium]